MMPCCKRCKHRMPAKNPKVLGCQLLHNGDIMERDVIGETYIGWYGTGVLFNDVVVSHDAYSNEFDVDEEDGWAGNPKGRKEDTKRCIQEVWPTDGWLPYQCQRKRGYGKDGLYCKQHAKKNPQ